MNSLVGNEKHPTKLAMLKPSMLSQAGNNTSSAGHPWQRRAEPWRCFLWWVEGCLQPIGGKTAPAFWALLKKMSFSPWRNYWSSSQKSLNFPGENQVVLTCFPVIYREFCAQKSPYVAVIFFLFQLSMRFCNMRPVFSKRFSLELCQRHCQILMLRINFGLTWPLTLVARLHGMADLDSLHIASTPPVWIRILLFLILFLMEKIPFEWLQAVCRKLTWTLTSPPHPTQDVM